MNMEMNKMDEKIKAKEKKGLKRFLNKFFKIFIIFMIATAVINLLILAVVYGNHKSKLKKEVSLLNTTGQFVEVNGHSMHIIVQGDENAKETLVFLHSSNITDDSIALKPLFDELNKEYRVVYLDRSGVGFSDVSGSDRQIDNVLDETRAAIKAAGIEGQVYVVPIGTAGVEAIHWASKYPDELKGIIGINMIYPEQFNGVTAEEYCGFFDYLMVPFYSIGGQRFVQSVYPDNKYGLYTDTQMLTRNALISKAGYTKDMYNENLCMVDNAKMVAAEGWPENTKMYLIYANPLMEPYRSSSENVTNTYEEALEENSEVDYVAEYNKAKMEYFQNKELVTFEEMCGPSRLYTYDPKALAVKISTYLNK